MNNNINLLEKVIRVMKCTESALKNGEYQINLSMAIKICFALLSDYVVLGNVNSLTGNIYY